MQVHGGERIVLGIHDLTGIWGVTVFLSPQPFFSLSLRIPLALSHTHRGYGRSARPYTHQDGRGDREGNNVRHLLRPLPRPEDPAVPALLLRRLPPATGGARRPAGALPRVPPGGHVRRRAGSADAVLRQPHDRLAREGGEGGG